MAENQGNMSTGKNPVQDASLSADFKKLFDENDKELVQKLVEKYNLSEQALVAKLIDLKLV
jgi:hypothetical protein